MTYEEARRLADAIEVQQPGWIGMMTHKGDHRVGVRVALDSDAFGVMSWDHTTDAGYATPYTYTREDVLPAPEARERRATA